MTECHDCYGAGSYLIRGCGHSHGNCPCATSVGRCETCDGRGTLSICGGCGDNPIDLAFGPELCEPCAKSCRICEQGTAQSGIICKWCVESEMQSDLFHEQTHKADSR